MDELDAADAQASGGLVENEETGFAVELAGHDQLLLVAARKRLGRNFRRWRPDVVLTYPLLGCIENGVSIPEQAARERQLVVAGQHQVVSQREGQDETKSVPVGRHI